MDPRPKCKPKNVKLWEQRGGKLYDIGLAKISWYSTIAVVSW